MRTTITQLTGYALYSAILFVLSFFIMGQTFGMERVPMSPFVRLLAGLCIAAWVHWLVVLFRKMSSQCLSSGWVTVMFFGAFAAFGLFYCGFL